MNNRKLISTESMSKNPPRYTHTEFLKPFGMKINNDKKERVKKK